MHLNTRDGRFVPQAAVGTGLDKEQATRSVLFGDIDSDGDTDVIALNVQDHPQLLVNRVKGPHWLSVTTAHPEFGTPLLGARIEVDAGGLTQCYTVQGAYSFLAHNDTRVSFGLGAAERIDALRVTWVGGRKESYGAMPANHLVVLTPGKGAAVKDLATGTLVETVTAQ